MFLRMIYDERLAQAAYLIGCQRTREAIVFDPERDVDRYIKAAESNGMRLTAVAETHIHADFLSGARELAERVGARVYVSGEGGPDWQYQWLDKKQSGGAYDHRVLKHGDSFRIGNIEFKVVHTPGHTPEHVVYIVTDHGAGASEPMGIISGDFVFVGDLGRPDLLETAAGVEGAKEPSARSLLASVREFLKLPDYLQVWPAHGAGSACGKALGAVPQSTVGYERRFNPSILAAANEEDFVRYILSGQPEPPTYFARMKRDNRNGPAVLGGLPKPFPMSAEEAAKLDKRSAVVADTRPWKSYRAGHLPGSIFVPQDTSFPTIAGSYIGENEAVYLVVDAARAEEAVRDLVRIGLDRVVGIIEPAAVEKWVASSGKAESIPEIEAASAKELISKKEARLLDVRREDEWREGHAPDAMHAPHTRLSASLDRLPRDTPLIVTCRSGMRASRAAAYLQRCGFNVTNLAGGMLSWESSGLPTTK